MQLGEGREQCLTKGADIESTRIQPIERGQLVLLTMCIAYRVTVTAVGWGKGGGRKRTTKKVGIKGVSEVLRWARDPVVGRLLLRITAKVLGPMLWTEHTPTIGVDFGFVASYGESEKGEPTLMPESVARASLICKPGSGSSVARRRARPDRVPISAQILYLQESAPNHPRPTCRRVSSQKGRRCTCLVIQRASRAASLQ
ncbi:hypothetical protein EV401DRAFT_1605995 [Pisolithus croceorrhizus]|nr:hypothetical protein EV401DRAFT_1605995 [Pisolithus croceorrhizus]